MSRELDVRATREPHDVVRVAFFDADSGEELAWLRISQELIDQMVRQAVGEDR